MKNSKKKLKGMTLIEMIISIFLFAVMGGLLLLIGSHIDATSRAANTLKEKVSDESPYAANHIKETKINGVDTELPKTEVEIEVSLKGTNLSGKYYKLKDETKPELGNDELQYNNNTGVVITGDKYNTEDVYTDGMSASEITAMRQRANGGLNFQFIEMQPETPATPATPATPSNP